MIKAFVNLNLSQPTTALPEGHQEKKAVKDGSRYRIYNPENRGDTVTVPRDFNPDTDYACVGVGQKDGTIKQHRVPVQNILASENPVVLPATDGKKVVVAVNMDTGHPILGVSLTS